MEVVRVDSKAAPCDDQSYHYHGGAAGSTGVPTHDALHISLFVYVVEGLVPHDFRPLLIVAAANASSFLLAACHGFLVVLCGHPSFFPNIDDGQVLARLRSFICSSWTKLHRLAYCD